MNKGCEIYPGERYHCHNCGFTMEVVEPCDSCGEEEIKCPFCGEHMTKKLD